MILKCITAEYSRLEREMRCNYQNSSTIKLYLQLKVYTTHSIREYLCDPKLEKFNFINQLKNIYGQLELLQ